VAWLVRSRTAEPGFYAKYGRVESDLSFLRPATGKLAIRSRMCSRSQLARAILPLSFGDQTTNNVKDIMTIGINFAALPMPDARTTDDVIGYDADSLPQWALLPLPLYSWSQGAKILPRQTYLCLHTENAHQLHCRGVEWS
jgi:hypothetical protein